MVCFFVACLLLFVLCFVCLFVVFFVKEETDCHIIYMFINLVRVIISVSLSWVNQLAKTVITSRCHLITTGNLQTNSVKNVFSISLIK